MTSPNKRCHTHAASLPGSTGAKHKPPSVVASLPRSLPEERWTLDAGQEQRAREIDGVEQLSRYLARLRPTLGTVAGVLVALEFKPQARVLAAERSIECVQVDYDELRGVESDLLRLF
jgi:endonuclease